ncbi:hypothetical protein [Yinghuangia seranimata]|uniref:hypothetical protein n=1 Tax=Yinghuangia seranimata TaxID=408067 RepID=UPI00248AE4BB|nr:hypothetical protein [Yinghuangia seranimata]MDI2128161.1 hypothetical protein [Yinghuangia seranimata]
MQANDARLLRGSAIPTAAVAIVAMVVGAVVAGGKGLIGAAFASVVVLVFFSLGQIAIGKITNGNPMLIMNMAMLTYLAQVGGIAILLFAFADATWFDTKVFAIVILCATVVWIAAQVRVFSKLKIAYVEPDGKR